MLTRRRTLTACLLADALRPHCDPLAIVCATPGGSVLLGSEVAERLSLPLELVGVRSLYSGHRSSNLLGAVTEDRHSALQPGANEQDEALADYAVRQAEEAKKDRDASYGFVPHLSLFARSAILVDQGDINPYWVAAVIKSLRSRGAARVIVAAPFLYAENYSAAVALADGVVVLAHAPARASTCVTYEEFPTSVLDEIIGHPTQDRAA